MVGAKVADRENKTGKVVSVSNSMCEVVLDGTGKKTYYLFWMLHAAGSSAETDDKLVNGKYGCYTSSGGLAQLYVYGYSDHRAGYV